jgi:hypothetical protein
MATHAAQTFDTAQSALMFGMCERILYVHVVWPMGERLGMTALQTWRGTHAYTHKLSCMWTCVWTHAINAQHTRVVCAGRLREQAPRAMCTST